MLLVKSIGVCATLGSDLNFPLFGPKDYVKSKSISCSVVSYSLQLHGLILPDSSVHRILQTRILEWVAISFSRGSSQPMD